MSGTFIFIVALIFLMHTVFNFKGIFIKASQCSSLAQSIHNTNILHLCIDIYCFSLFFFCDESPLPSLYTHKA